MTTPEEYRTRKLAEIEAALVACREAHPIARELYALWNTPAGKMTLYDEEVEKLQELQGLFCNKVLDSVHLILVVAEKELRQRKAALESGQDELGRDWSAECAERIFRNDTDTTR